MYGEGLEEKKKRLSGVPGRRGPLRRGTKQSARQPRRNGLKRRRFMAAPPGSKASIAAQFTASGLPPPMPPTYYPNGSFLGYNTSVRPLERAIKEYMHNHHSVSAFYAPPPTASENKLIQTQNTSNVTTDTSLGAVTEEASAAGPPTEKKVGAAAPTAPAAPTADVKTELKAYYALISEFVASGASLRDTAKTSAIGKLRKDFAARGIETDPMRSAPVPVTTPYDESELKGYPATDLDRAITVFALFARYSDQDAMVHLACAYPKKEFWKSYFTSNPSGGLTFEAALKPVRMNKGTQSNAQRNARNKKLKALSSLPWPDPSDNKTYDAVMNLGIHAEHRAHAQSLANTHVREAFHAGMASLKSDGDFTDYYQLWLKAPAEVATSMAPTQRPNTAIKNPRPGRSTDLWAVPF